jgi:hypothetical protein
VQVQPAPVSSQASAQEVVDEPVPRALQTSTLSPSQTCSPGVHT